MPRPRTPIAVAEATGAVDHNPKRFADRMIEATPDGPIGDPPAHLDDIDRDLWREIVAMPAAGVLTSGDRLLVEITVSLTKRFRYWERLDLPRLSATELGHLRACLGSMGLTPADRSRVTGSNAPAEDPLAGFLN